MYYLYTLISIEHHKPEKINKIVKPIKELQR